LPDYQDARKCLNAFFEREIQSLNHPGLAIGVTDRQRFLFGENYGLANRDTLQPVTPDTLFQIGSISKAFTSITLLQLQEQGLLNIEDRIIKHLPWFEIQSEYPPVTLRHLMSHTAGIITGADETPAAFTEAWSLRDTRATASPGEMFHYSNSGYKVLGLVLQTILGQPIAEILHQHLLDPLDMQATEPVFTHAIRPRLAVGYESYYDDRPLPRGGLLAPATWFESDTADGSICSTAENMCHYVRSLLNRCHGLLAPESFSQLIQPIIPTGDGIHGEHYGLGLSTRQIDGHQVIGHSGGMVGYTADLLADLDAGLGVVVLTNGPGDPEKISQYVLRLLRAIQDGDKPLPDYKEDPLAHPVEDYAGTYGCDHRNIILTQQHGQLYLESEDNRIPLEARGPDVFLVPHPAFDLFPLRFRYEPNPENEEKTSITAALHGPHVYIPVGVNSSPIPSYPPEWQAYPGHYRSHNPWFTNFRVVLRNGDLILIHPSGEEEPLHPKERGGFRIGADPRSPEFINFEAIIDGKAMRANLSGGAYCRTFTP
jgi:D-alanyl-D-alanine carboxypeptidase